MEEILEDIPMTAGPKVALLGDPNSHKKVFDLVVSYERANWTVIPELASRLGIDQCDISEIY